MARMVVGTPEAGAARVGAAEGGAGQAPRQVREAQPGAARSAAALWDEPPRFVDVGSARVAWRTIGKGEPLLLLHGWPFSSFAFRRVLPRLAEHFTCVLPDTPGLGETEWHEETDFRFAAQAETLRAFARAIGLGSYRVLAFDTGGTIARQLALIDAPRVRSLVLLDTEIPGHRPPFIPFFQRTARLPGSRFSMRALLRSPRLQRSALGFGGCFVDLALLDGDFQRGFVEPLLASPRRLEGSRRYLLGIDWALVDGLARRHREISAPVLFVWGEDDPIFPVERARPMQAQLADCRGFVAIPGARLLVHEEQPARVCDAALPFLLAS